MSLCASIAVAGAASLLLHQGSPVRVRAELSGDTLRVWQGDGRPQLVSIQGCGQSRSSQARGRLFVELVNDHLLLPSLVYSAEPSRRGWFLTVDDAIQFEAMEGRSPTHVFTSSIPAIEEVNWLQSYRSFVSGSSSQARPLRLSSRSMLGEVRSQRIERRSIQSVVQDQAK
jgi:hypothetical protein